MKEVKTVKKIVKKFTVFGEKHSYSEVEDCTDLVNEWITNGSNGTRTDVLYYMRDGSFEPGDSSTCVSGWLEALAQGPNCPQFVYDNQYSQLKVETEQFEE